MIYVREFNSIFSYPLPLHLSKIFNFVPVETTPFCIHISLIHMLYKSLNFNNKYSWNNHHKQLWKQTQSTLSKCRTQLLGAEVYAVLECGCEHSVGHGPQSLCFAEGIGRLGLFGVVTSLQDDPQ